MTVRLLFLEDFLGFIRNLNRVLDEGGGLKDSFGGWVGLSSSRRGDIAREYKSFDIGYIELIPSTLSRLQCQISGDVH
jgi:hypothetical protein